MKNKLIYLMVLMVMLTMISVSAFSYQVTINVWEGVNLETRMAQPYTDPNTYLWWDSVYLDDFYGSNQYFYDVGEVSCSEYVGQAGVSNIETGWDYLFCHFDANTSRVYHVNILEVNDAEGYMVLVISGDDVFSGSGDGSSGNPYQITNCTQLQEMNNDLDAYYVLGNNIDCSDTINWNGGLGWVPIGGIVGGGNPFTGIFDGNNHVISDIHIHNEISDGLEIYYGLFGVTQDAVLKNFKVINIDVLLQSGSAGSQGCIVGIASTTNISGVGCSGNIVVNDSFWVGGLVGIHQAGFLTNSYFNGNITGGDGIQAGGLTASSYETQIIDSYAGALINYGATSVVCGISGELGYNISGSYYDDETTILSSCSNDYSVGVSTVEMKTESTFVGWDFVNTWRICSGEYPVLRVFSEECPVVPVVVNRNPLGLGGGVDTPKDSVVLVPQSALGGTAGGDTSAFARLWNNVIDWLVFWK